MSCTTGTLSPASWSCIEDPCPALEGIANAPKVTCKEGKSIESTKVCTTLCILPWKSGKPVLTFRRFEWFFCGKWVRPFSVQDDFHCYMHSSLRILCFCAFWLLYLLHRFVPWCWGKSGYTPNYPSMTCRRGKFFRPRTYICEPDACPLPKVQNRLESGCSGLPDPAVVNSGSSCSTQCAPGYSPSVDSLKCFAGKLTPDAQKHSVSFVWIQSSLRYNFELQRAELASNVWQFSYLGIACMHVWDVLIWFDMSHLNSVVLEKTIESYCSSTTIVCQLFFLVQLAKLAIKSDRPISSFWFQNTGHRRANEPRAPLHAKRILVMLQVALRMAKLVAAKKESLLDRETAAPLNVLQVILHQSLSCPAVSGPLRQIRTPANLIHAPYQGSVLVKEMVAGVKLEHTSTQEPHAL